MDETELLSSFRYLKAEIDALRARNDVVTTALKRVILRSNDPHGMYESVMAGLDLTSVQALYSSEATEAYLVGWDAAKQVLARWREALPPVAP